jgi:hypothetical protein
MYGLQQCEELLAPTLTPSDRLSRTSSTKDMRERSEGVVNVKEASRSLKEVLVCGRGSRGREGRKDRARKRACGRGHTRSMFSTATLARLGYILYLYQRHMVSTYQDRRRGYLLSGYLSVLPGIRAIIHGGTISERLQVGYYRPCSYVGQERIESRESQDSRLQLSRDWEKKRDG